MSMWKDYNGASNVQFGDLIPRDTIVKVRLSIEPGGYDDVSQDWTGGYATRSTHTGSVYLHTRLTVLEGIYARWTIRHLIGLYSDKGANWAQQGQTFIKHVLHSAHGIMPDDESPQAQQQRRIKHFGDLDGLIFAVQVDMQKDSQGSEQNAVRRVVVPSDKAYAQVMGQRATATMPNTGHQTTPTASPQPPQSWA